MKHTWFTHPPMTNTEAEELLRRYKAKGVRTERGLSLDLKLITVSALLPESDYLPPNRYQQAKYWQ